MNGGVESEVSGTTSPTLLERVRLQDPAAWERFARLYGPVIFRWCRTARLQPEDASDVMQEVFHAVFNGISRFQRNAVGQSLRGWLYTITRRRICDHFRRRLNEPAADGGTHAHRQLNELAIPADDPEPVSAYVTELSHRALTLIQTEFTATTWQAFWKMAIEGCSAAETAATLGLTQAAAFKAKSRVLNRLRRELDGLFN